MTDLIPRIGTFFIIIGMGLFVLFVASDFAETPQFDYLCLAILAIGVGWLFQRRRPAPPSAGRFSLVQRTRENVRKRREERNKPPDKGNA